MSEHEYPAAFVLLAYTFLVNQASHGLFFFSRVQLSYN